MADLPILEDDDVLVFQDASVSGDRYPNDGTIRLHARNLSGAVITLTFAGQTPVLNHPDQPIVDRALTVDAVSTREMPVAQPRWFNDAQGYVNVTYSTNIGLAVAAVRARNAR